MTARQLAFALPSRPAWNREDFLVTPGNAAAAAMIDRWPDWPRSVLILTGPAGCGKTHLAQVWRKMASAKLVRSARPLPAPGMAVVFDNADRMPSDEEENLLHLINRAQENRSGLLLTGRLAPGHWPMSLPDLRSRIRALPMVSMPLPDDDLIAGVLVKLFADRQLSPPPPVISWLAQRSERSLSHLRELTARLDRAALTAHAPISIALARKLLEEDDG